MHEDFFDKLKDLPPDKQLFYLRAKELGLKEIELRQNENVKSKQWWQNPLYLAAFGLFGNIAVSYFNSCNQQKIERDKLNSSAIIEAIKTGDTASAKRNIKFLLGIGFLNDNNGTIRKYLDSTINVPVLPSSGISYEHTYPYLRTDTIQSNSSLSKLSACVGLLKFYNGNKITMSSTAVSLDENTVVFPKKLMFRDFKHDKVTFTLNYVNKIKKGEEIHLVTQYDDTNNNGDFIHFNTKSNYKFKNNLTEFEQALPKINQEILIIQHPLAEAKVIASNETCKIINASDKESIFSYNCKTTAGSGGGLVITSDFKVIGLHIGRNKDNSKYGIAFHHIKKK